MRRIKAAIYCRVSPYADESTITQYIELQKTILLDKAEATSFNVVEVYEDVGYLGNDMERPGLKRLLHDHQAGKFSVVLVYNRDRLLKGAGIEIPDWPFEVLSATPFSDSEKECEKMARYMRTGKVSEETLEQQRSSARRIAKKHGYR